MPKLSRDGIALHYLESGAGANPIVFIHPWGGDHSYFAAQIDHFAKRHRVIAIDLRGHGQSDKPDGDYTVESFAEDLEWLLQQLGVAQPILVGNSIGGVIALELAKRVPVRAVACLDSTVAPPAGVMDSFRPLTQALRSPHWQAAARAVNEKLGGFADKIERREQLIASFISTPQHVIASTLEQLIPYDSEAAAAAFKAPLLYISAGTGLADLARLRQLCPQLLTGETVGSGHYPSLEVPDQVNAMLARFFELCLR